METRVESARAPGVCVVLDLGCGRISVAFKKGRTSQRSEAWNRETVGGQSRSCEAVSSAVSDRRGNGRNTQLSALPGSGMNPLSAAGS